jgi:hypothetical protein
MVGKTKLSIVLILLFAVCVNSALFSQDKKSDNVIQIAILLDTSNSMDGLIDQARSQLWKIVNELSKTKQKGSSPSLEVSLFEYGNDNIQTASGYIRLASKLTTDLDKISDELFKLQTRGGNEYCGQVIEEAVNKLDWSKNNNVLKMIFIAGNEEFTQGNFSYKTACKDAIKNGITVNTIFCGNFQEGVDTFWKDGADLSDGNYFNIDQGKTQVYIKAPQDDEILKLNSELNDTYLAYGNEGREKKEIQAKQDRNASINKESQIQRSVTKSTSNYKNSSWDIVDAVNDKSVKIEDIKEADLPDNMKKMTIEQRKKYVEDMIKKRESIQIKITKLDNERNEYLKKEREKNGTNDTLDNAMLKAIKNQAKNKNYDM